MIIGPQHDISRLFQQANELSAAIPARIRQAHQSALESATTDGVAAEAAPSTEPGEQINPQGAQLRSKLEDIVLDVLTGAHQQDLDVLDRAISLIVEHRFESLELKVDPSLQESVMDEMSRDPTVVAELDQLLQSIARQLPR